MMTVTRLLLLRIVSDWKYQYQVFRTAVDWIVAIYIVIPFSYIFIDFYLSLWREVPGWLFSIPLNALIGIILVFIWSGTVQYASFWRMRISSFFYSAKYGSTASLSIVWAILLAQTFCQPLSYSSSWRRFCCYASGFPLRKLFG